MTVAETDSRLPIVVPGGNFLLTADFVRDGADLLLVGANGRTVLVRGYFAQEIPADLISDSGARLAGPTVLQLAGPLAPGVFAQADPTAPLDAIGTVSEASGPIFVVRADGIRLPAGKDTAIRPGDVIETADGSNVSLTFADGTTFALGSSGRMIVQEMTFDPASGSGHAALTVVQGTFAFVSGQIAALGGGAMTVTTPVGVIDVNGSNVALQATIREGANIVTLMPGATGSTGTVTMTNAGGRQTLDSPYESTRIGGAQQAPAARVTLSPADTVSIFGAVGKTLALDPAGLVTSAGPPLIAARPHNPGNVPSIRPCDAATEHPGSSGGPQSLQSVSGGGTSSAGSRRFGHRSHNVTCRGAASPPRFSRRRPSRPTHRHLHHHLRRRLPRSSSTDRRMPRFAPTRSISSSAAPMPIPSR